MLTFVSPKFVNQLSVVDILSIMSFVIGLMNFEENLTQSDKQDLVDQFNDKAEYLLKEIHDHLEQQDQKIDWILQRVGG